MDKFMENPWFIRIIAMLLAILLFVSVNDLSGKKAGTTPNGMENIDTETIVNVPVELYYDAENLVVSGVPQTVDVKIEGQRRFVEATKRQRDFKVYIDLSDVKIGNQRVPIKYSDISEKLKVHIEPSYADISLQEKITEDFKVEAEFNRSILADGFEAERPEVEPKTVKITGAKDIIEKISYVKATIDASGLINDTIRREAKVTVLDRELNKLDVIVEPGSVSVTIPVKNPRKNVPIKIKTTGTPMDDIVIKTVSTVTPEVMVFGRTEILQDVNELEVSVDISNIQEDSEIEVPIKYPLGVNKITPDKIKVKIIAEKKLEETTLNDIPVESKGLDPNLELELLSPADGAVSLKLTGEQEDLKKAAESTFEVFINTEGLDVGDHEVELEVEGPTNVDWELSVKKVKIRLTEKEDV
ncbi:CdaR family protein [Lederbergia citrea]|uniref:YbbR-like domain-containing protein n=1 Tax=Lederbergia citrea TaxID=2833581 RepID=A0A942Z6D4_9BACI|nr:CdaR family protein [Lederbergia citrea]MBS4179098.1 YbbR-like domain-containing protein [Lederbergia citrea]MBS4223906.1 YbbR-like domain-containing protein [Lederbergia citrea]